MEVGKAQDEKKTKKEEEKGVAKKRRRRWWKDGGTDGQRDGRKGRRGLEVDGGQPAAGGLRELGQHAGQRPVLGLQPLFDLPQGLNLLYLGEVLQQGGGGGGVGWGGTTTEREREGDAVEEREG